MSQAQGKFMLIDGHSLLHRAFHALPTMTTSGGVHTNAVYGFATMLTRLLDDEKPDYAAVAFDRATPTFRHVAYAEYKANRPEMAAELRMQIPLVRDLVTHFRLPICECDGYEADDVIGTLARQARTAGCSVVIVTGDKDALQLVEPGVEVLLTRRGITDMERFDTEAVKERLGVYPHQVVDLKALMGDASDNIPGVAGIGAKTAARLLQDYGDLDSLLAHVEEIKGKAGTCLRDQKEQAILSRRLATIDTNAPIALEWNDFVRREPDIAGLTALYTQLEARALLGQLQRRYGADKAEGPAPEQASLFSVEPAVDQVPLERAARLVQGEQLRAKAAALAAPLTLLGAAGAGGKQPHAMWCSVADDKELLAAGAVPAGLVCQLIGGGAEVWGHDLKAQLVAAGHQGAELPEPEQLTQVDDIMLASYLTNPAQGDHSLDDIAVKAGYGTLVPLPEEELPAREEEAPLPEGWSKALAQRHSVLRAAQALFCRRLEEDNLQQLYRTVEIPLIAVLAKMECTGIAIDRGRLAAMSVEMRGEIERLSEAIYAAAGEKFNINSPKQLAVILFEKLRLPVKKSTKTGPSTSADVLEELAYEHELPRLILDYRQLVKLTGTYVDALPEQINAATGRVHTTFNQAVAATGRLSSTNPNLQNIPVRTALGRQIRSAFVPGGPDQVLLSADYSQIELRVLAHLSQDANLLAAFRSGADIHTKTAAEVFGVPIEQVTPEMRSGAKAINFGIVYGISSFGLARGTGLSRHAAQEYINSYFDRYPGVKNYLTATVAEARARGYVTTILGRRRYLPDLHSRRWQERSFAERTAMNTPIQGSAADIIKLAMIRVYKRLRDEGLPARMLLQVHDELLFEVPAKELEHAAALIREEMERAYELDVPLKVDVGAGPNWLDIEEIPDA